MKKQILPILGILFLASCAAKPAQTETPVSNKVVGTSPSFTGNKALTESAIAEGKKLYESSCAKCHDLPNAAKYNDEKWVGIMNAMAPKAKLTDKESELVYNYVTFKN